MTFLKGDWLVVSYFAESNLQSIFTSFNRYINARPQTKLLFPPDALDISKLKYSFMTLTANECERSCHKLSQQLSLRLPVTCHEIFNYIACDNHQVISKVELNLRYIFRKIEGVREFLSRYLPRKFSLALWMKNRRNIFFEESRVSIIT